MMILVHYLKKNNMSSKDENVNGLSGCFIFFLN